MAKAKKPAKKAEKKTSSKTTTLNEFQLRFAQKMKYNKKIQFMLMEFVMMALDLSGDSMEDKALARKVISDIKRKVK